jgi:hypothetical protein
VRSRRGGRRGSEDEEDEEEPAKVIPLTERRRETIDLVNFIDAHGGKLGGFRGYQVRPPPPPPEGA